MWRYYGMHKFEFGPQIPFINKKGKPSSQSQWGLIVGCPWQLFGPGGFELSSQKDQTLPWLEDLYKLMDTDPPTVTEILCEDEGNLRINMTEGFEIVVSPPSAVEEEEWFLLLPEVGMVGIWEGQWQGS